jgi:hypothetical protein
LPGKLENDQPQVTPGRSRVDIDQQPRLAIGRRSLDPGRGHQIGQRGLRRLQGMSLSRACKSAEKKARQRGNETNDDEEFEERERSALL